MEHWAELDAVLAFLLGEAEFAGLGGSRRIPEDYAGCRRLLRALMNLRDPRPVPLEVLTAQDALLGAECRERGIVDALALPTAREAFRSPLRHAEKFCLWQGDITRLKAGAIVNAANSAMLGCRLPLHACIDNAIHSAAGMQLRQECHDSMLADPPPGGHEPTGRARVTGAYNLPCARVIHTVGPIVNGPLTDKHRADLASCYRACLGAAATAQCGTLVFCSVSTGEFRFPKPEAATIALETASRFFDEQPDALERVIFDVFSQADYDLYQGLLCEPSC